MVLEVHLHNFVAQSEHDCVFRSHPLFHVNRACWILRFLFVSLKQLRFLCWVVILFKVRLEMLQERHFLLEFLRETSEAILRHNILLLVGSDCFPFVVIKLSAG